MKAFRDVEDQERFFRRTQVDKYTHLYTATFSLPYDTPANTPVHRSGIMQVEEDASFHVTHIIGSVVDPVEIANHQRAEPASPSFAMAGVTTGRTDRGLDFKISDPGSGRTLVNVTNSRNITLEGGFIPFAAVFAPGYAFRFREPVPFDYFIDKKRRLLLEVRNRGTIDAEGGSGYGVRVTFGFLGHRVNA